MESTVDITEFFRKLKCVCHWAGPFKDLKWSNVPEAFALHWRNCFAGLLYLASVVEFALSFQWFHGLSLVLDDMLYSCLIEYPRHSALTARI
nr:hypothetical protein [Tanacetum cinerariifolium]